jgi:hypothetical protein
MIIPVRAFDRTMGLLVDVPTSVQDLTRRLET